MTDTIRYGSVTLDCPDPPALAAFYAQITGGKVVHSDPQWAQLEAPGGRIDFQAVRDYVPPDWPDPRAPIQMHLDLEVDDLAVTEARVLAAGARKYAFQPNSDHCYVYADPAGHAFCLSTWAGRPSPESRSLAAHLDGVRRHVLGILDGLDDEQLRRPVLPSGWSCLGLVAHLTRDVERFWFRGVVAAEPAVTADVGGDAWRVGADVPARAVLDAYREEAARSDAVLTAAYPDAAPAWWPPGLFGDWRPADVREVALHVLVETATHAGHLDAARELLDGRTWLVLDP